jgi:hypothetical protein
MSVTFSIACPETKKRLWIGQGKRTDDMKIFYSAELETMLYLADFLNEHLGMPLIVTHDEDPMFDQLDYIDYEQSHILNQQVTLEDYNE